MPRTTGIRGVYRLDFLSLEGWPVYIAVTRDGRRIEERTLHPFESEAAVIADLRVRLDCEDPNPDAWRGGDHA